MFHSIGGSTKQTACDIWNACLFGSWRCTPELCLKRSSHLTATDADNNHGPLHTQRIDTYPIYSSWLLDIYEERTSYQHGVCTMSVKSSQQNIGEMHKEIRVVFWCCPCRQQLWSDDNTFARICIVNVCVMKATSSGRMFNTVSVKQTKAKVS